MFGQGLRPMQSLSVQCSKVCWCVQWLCWVYIDRLLDLALGTAGPQLAASSQQPVMLVQTAAQEAKASPNPLSIWRASMLCGPVLEWRLAAEGFSCAAQQETCSPACCTTEGEDPC